MATRFPDAYQEDQGLFMRRDRRADQAETPDRDGQRFGALFAAASDLSSLSLELRRHLVDWPAQFHLSPRRANLLRPLQSRIAGRVLEVGAGCGAITRFLGECGAEVVALEPQPDQARAAHLRTRDLPNVTVVCDRAEDVDFDAPFDVVTLIGAQAYTRVPGADGDYLAPVLAALRAKLKPGGILILADDNRLGLKYFAGAAEGGEGRPFDGLNNRQGGDAAPTLGRGEIASRLALAEFADTEWRYPFPDYRLPMTILSQLALTGADADDFTPLFASSNFDDPLRARPGTFSLEQAWTVVARNGLTEHLANSFLVVCRAPGGAAARPDATRVAWHYSVDRHPAFAKSAVFERDAAGAVTVRRAPVSDAAPPVGPVRLVLEDEPFFQGPLWSNELAQVLNNPGWTADEVAGWLRFWITRLLAEAGIGSGADLMSTLVPGRFQDAMPFNLVVAPDGGSHFIDLEWERDEPLGVLYLAYRALSKTLIRVSSCAAPAHDRHLLINLLIKDVFRLLGLAIDVETMRVFEQDDRRLQSLARFGTFTGAKPGRLRTHVRILKTRPGEADSLAQRGLQFARQLLGK